LARAGEPVGGGYRAAKMIAAANSLASVSRGRRARRDARVPHAAEARGRADFR
jgi:hypothetical protein